MLEQDFIRYFVAGGRSYKDIFPVVIDTKVM